MSRTRSEYRLTALDRLPLAPDLTVRRPVDDDRVELATLLLEGYRGSIDDEGEDHEDALEAIDHYLSTIYRYLSVVQDVDGSIGAMCFVVEVEGLRYIDPIVVRPAAKRQGLGRDLVLVALHGLRDAGFDEIGAVITDGNTPSERLFASLGFTRHGAWG